MKHSWLRSLSIVVLAAGVLSGCATGYRLDNQVQSFSGLPALPANPTYRFERLPSQQTDPNQAQLEALADPALFKAGLRRDDATPRYSVQVSARVLRILSPWSDPYWGSPYGWSGGHHGAFMRFPQPEPSWHQREVGIVVREVSSGKVVFESRASNDGPMLDPNLALAGMFEAALQGFPNTPPGPRRVDVQLGQRKG